MSIEHRSRAGPVECRAGAGGESHGTITGIAAVFNSKTVIGDLWVEQIAPTAFDKALSNPDDVRALYNHNHDAVLGRTTSHTLRLSKTSRGLRYEIDLPDTAVARDVRSLIARGNVSGSSFGFHVLADEWDDRPVRVGKLPVRTITNVELLDVSPVTYPAYVTTSVATRATASALSGRDDRRMATLQLRVALARAQAWDG